MKASIHSARFLDIGVNERINATVPWHYKALEGEQQFAKFDLAFERFEGRVLLLGAPGSGKTTTLLNLCLQLIEAAQKNPEADIPLLFNLSKFSNVPTRRISQQLNWLRKRVDPRAENPARVFEQWLIDMLVAMRAVEGLNRQVAEDWVNSGQVALLLDGLDELNDDYLLKLAEIINETYFPEHPLQTVVICSRIIEYQPLQEDKDLRLHGMGAVVLQPPTPQQIDEYLEKAEALSLRDALRSDNALYEMAQTPLILSMMTLAYGGQAPTDIPQDLPFIERRRMLLDTYVERMVQRTARRERDIPFDLNPDNDVPPAYPLPKLNHYLGWLAIKLSERAQTLFPLSQFYRFLSEEPQEVQLRFVGLKYGVAMIAVWIVAVLTNAGLLLPQQVDPFWALLMIPLLAPLTVALVGLMQLAEKSVVSAVVALAGLVPIVLFVIVTFVGLVHHALSTLLGFRVHPFFVSLLFFPVFLLASAPSVDRLTLQWRLASESYRSVRWQLLTAGVHVLPLVLGGAIGALAGGELKHVIHGVSVAGLLTAFAILWKTEFDDSSWVSYLVPFAIISGVSVWALAAIGSLLGSRALLWLAIDVTILLGLAASAVEWVGTSLSLAVTVVVAYWIGGPSLAVLAAAAVALVHRFGLRNQVARLMETLLFNPVLKLTLFFARSVCLRYRAFLDYATASMLLKRVGTEYEFVHRLLRDHFAVRELVPKLLKAEGEERIAIIKRISYQGESSFDALADLITDPDKNVRSAAITGLGRVAIPKVIPIMRGRVRSDPDEEVRAAVVHSLKKLPEDDKESILSIAMEDSSPRVRRAVVAEWKAERVLHRALNDKSEIVFQEVLIQFAERQPWTIDDVTLTASLADRLRSAVLGDNEQVCIGAARTVAALRRTSGDDRSAEENALFLETLFPALIARSKHRKPTVRAAMIAAISTIARRSNLTTAQQDEIKTILMAALSDKKESVRHSAIAGLATLRLPHTRSALLAALARGNDEQKSLIIEEFGDVRDELAVPALLPYLHRRELRYRVAVTLAEIGDDSIVPQLMKMLENPRLQIAAIMSLALLEAKVAIPALRELFARPPRKRPFLSFFRAPEDVRPYAAIALATIGGRSVLPDLLKLSTATPGEVLASQIAALRSFPSAVYESLLIEALNKLPADELNLLRLRIHSLAWNVPEVPPFLMNEPLSRLIAYYITSPDWEFNPSAWKNIADTEFISNVVEVPE